MPRSILHSRRPLWDIDGRFHCGLIGTCAPLDDLRRICRRAGIQFQTRVTDYELHHAFVALADRPGYAIRLLQRRLDARHRASLRRFAAAEDARALRKLWEAASTEGDIAGAYWALLTHPLADSDLCDCAAGELHMLSHAAAAARSAELRRIDHLQRRQRVLEQALREARQQATERQTLVAALQQRAAAATRMEADLVRLQHRLTQLENGEALTLARTRNEDLAATLAQARLTAERQTATAHNWMQRYRTLQQTADETARELAAISAERDSLEQLLQTSTRHCAQDCSSDCSHFDLCRRRILYVGGRPSLGPHFRQVVEQANGELLQHDGGREEADAALAALLPRADAVLCPADCISHSAMQRIKRLCKQQAKTFVVLRSASLSAFVRGLHCVSGNAPFETSGAVIHPHH